MAMTGNVSYLTPTLHTMFGISSLDNCFPHNPAFASAAGTDDAHIEAVVVGKSLALTGWDMLTDDDMYEAAHQQWKMEIERED